MTARYDTVIGLETHVQLKTNTKIFCGCANSFGEPPNSNVCPVCLGLPGALPVANREAFRLAIRGGLALGCEIAARTKFDRKNYFYPDLPKGYQISQFDQPVNGPGSFPLRLAGEGTVGITRAHLEEDAGKNIHGTESTCVDLNRAGIPLLEIVTDPDIDSAQMASDYLDELKLTMRHAGVSDCDMEKGSLRCDVNISLKPEGSEGLGAKVEIKNLNSFKMIRRAIEFEQTRQAAALDAGETIAVETRLWDNEVGETRSMRAKEDSADYRYFPDPDLPLFEIEEAWVDEIRGDLPELPGERFRRYVDELGIGKKDADVLIQDRAVADFFDAMLIAGTDATRAMNWVTKEIFAVLNEREDDLGDVALQPTTLASLISITDDGTVNHAGAQKILAEIIDTDAAPREVADRLGLIQMSDAAELEEIVKEALAANAEATADLRAGNKKAVGRIMGAIMKTTGGRANPKLVNEIIQKLI